MSACSGEFYGAPASRTSILPFRLPGARATTLTAEGHGPSAAGAGRPPSRGAAGTEAAGVETTTGRAPNVAGRAAAERAGPGHTRALAERAGTTRPERSASRPSTAARAKPSRTA